MAAKFLVVYLQVGPGAATLASPSVPLQRLLAEPVVQVRVQPKAQLFGPDSVHEAF